MVNSIYKKNQNACFVFFVCLGVFVPFNNFSHISRRHHCWWRTSNFDLYSALIAMSSEGSLACHTYWDTGHPFMMVITLDLWHIPFNERLAVEWSLSDLTTYVCRGWDSNTQPSAWKANPLTDCPMAPPPPPPPLLN